MSDGNFYWSNPATIQEIQKTLIDLKVNHFNALPRYIKSNWEYHYKELDFAVKAIPYVSSWHLWTIIRRTRLYIRSAIECGHLDFSDFPASSYDDPSSPFPTPESVLDESTSYIEPANNQEQMYD